MLSFQDFFAACGGRWITERTYHFVLSDEIERSHTEFQAEALSQAEKEQILSASVATASGHPLKVDVSTILQHDWIAPGFAVSFDTVSDKRSVAVDQMRFIAPDLRLRTIVTYQRPAPNETPTVIDLVGFGVERKQLSL